MPPFFSRCRGDEKARQFQNWNFYCLNLNGVLDQKMQTGRKLKEMLKNIFSRVYLRCEFIVLNCICIAKNDLIWAFDIQFIWQSLICNLSASSLDRKNYKQASIFHTLTSNCSKLATYSNATNNHYWIWLTLDMMIDGCIFASWASLLTKKSTRICHKNS